MSKKILVGLIFLSLIFVVLVSCGGETDVPQLPVAPVAPLVAPVAPPVVPVAPPVATPPPMTELVPVASAPTKSAGHGGSGIDKPLPGAGTSGDELLGNYMCAMTSSDFPLGLNPPPSGCKISRAGDGSLRLGPTGRSGGVSGAVTNTKASGFLIVGAYKFGNNKFNLKARMARKGAKKFSGKGRGVLNGNNAKGIKYTLTMTGR